jgi:hypothetical protein
MLPLVSAIVNDIVPLAAELEERRARLSRLDPGGSGPYPSDLYAEEVCEMQRNLEMDEERLREFIEELHALGVELADPLRGLVEFPANLAGCPGFLSWLPGEPTVSHFRESDDDAGLRRPLDELTVS